MTRELPDPVIPVIPTASLKSMAGITHDQSAPRTSYVREQVMVLSDSFRSKYPEWFMLLGSQSIDESEAHQLLNMALAELESLNISFRTHRINAASLATGKQFVRDLLEGILQQGSVLQTTKAQIRHLMIDHLPFQLLDVPGFRFSHDWFYFHIDQWSRSFSYLGNTSRLRFIEIGCFEGRCTCWMLSNLLSREGSQILCIDPFDAYEDQETNFDFNIRATKLAYKVTKLRGKSQTALPLLPKNSYDFVYIDGSHHAFDVIQDAVLSWMLLKEGGIMVFDDYEHPLFPGSFGLLVKPAVETFLRLITGRYELLFKDWQVAVKKLG